MAEPADPGKVIGAIIVLVLATLLIAYLFSLLSGVLGIGGVLEEGVELVSDTGTLSDADAVNLTFNQSLGTQALFDGTGSVSASTDLELGPDATVCTWARPVATGENMTTLSWDGEYRFQYHGANATPVWVGYFYNESSRTSTDVTVPANETSTPTLLCLETAGDTLTLSANVTRTASENMTTETAADTHIFNLSAWNGTVEETRVYNRSLNVTDETAFHGDPTTALKTTPADVRVMYDKRSLGAVSTIPVYADGAPGPYVGSVSGGVSVVSGFPEVAIVDGVDYTRSGGTITALAGGALENAPVVFVAGEGSGGPFAGLLTFIERISVPALTIMALLLFLLAGRFVNRTMQG